MLARTTQIAGEIGTGEIGTGDIGTGIAGGAGTESTGMIGAADADTMNRCHVPGVTVMRWHSVDGMEGILSGMVSFFLRLLACVSFSPSVCSCSCMDDTAR